MCMCIREHGCCIWRCYVYFIRVILLALWPRVRRWLPLRFGSLTKLSPNEPGIMLVPPNWFLQRATSLLDTDRGATMQPNLLRFTRQLVMFTKVHPDETTQFQFPTHPSWAASILSQVCGGVAEWKAAWAGRPKTGGG